MIRRIISRLRKLLVGPTLSKLSSLHADELRNLIAYSSTDPISNALMNGGDQAPTPTATAKTDSKTLEEVSDLKKLNAELTERVDVLERIMLKST